MNLVFRRHPVRGEISSVSFTPPPPRLFHRPKEKSATKEKGQDSSAAIIVDFMDPEAGGTEGGGRRRRRRQFAVLQIFFCAKKGRAERKEGEWMQATPAAGSGFLISSGK